MTDDSTPVHVERGPFEMVPHWLLYEGKASALSIRLYLVLRQHANSTATCYPSRQRLSDLLRVSLPTLDRARAQLDEVGAICMRQRRTQDQVWLPTLYHVHWDRALDCAWGSQESLPGVVKYLGDPSNESSTLTHTHRTKTQELAPPNDVDFGAFWDVYPRKVGRKDALKAFQAAVAEGTNPGRIIAGALRYRDDANREAAYTAHPATWLRAGRWDDDPLPARPQAATGGTRRMTDYERIYRNINNQRGEIEA
jgi:hypothetical protein